MAEADLGRDFWKMIKWQCSCGAYHLPEGYCPKCKETVESKHSLETTTLEKC